MCSLKGRWSRYGSLQMVSGETHRELFGLSPRQVRASIREPDAGSDSSPSTSELAQPTTTHIRPPTINFGIRGKRLIGS